MATTPFSVFPLGLAIPKKVCAILPQTSRRARPPICLSASLSRLERWERKLIATAGWVLIYSIRALPCITRHSASSITSTFADRGSPSKSAISPNISPSFIIESTISFPSSPYNTTFSLPDNLASLWPVSLFAQLNQRIYILTAQRTKYPCIGDGFRYIVFHVQFTPLISISLIRRLGAPTLPINLWSLPADSTLENNRRMLPAIAAPRTGSLIFPPSTQRPG